MTRKVRKLHDDPVVESVVRLRRLLGLVEAAAADNPLPPIDYGPEPPKPPADPFAFRRMMAMIEEREARRLARRRKSHPVGAPETE